MKKQQGKQFGIRKKLLIYFLTLSILPIIVGGTISFYITKNQCEKNTKAHLSDLARDCGRKISYYVNSRYHDIKLLAQSYVLKGVDTRQKQKYLEEVLTSYPFYDAIAVTDKKGMFTACTRKELIGQSRNNRSWFKKAMQSKQADVIPLDAYRAETAEWNMVIGFNAPITNENDTETIGVLATRVRMDHIIERIKALDERIVGDKSAYLINKRGEILAGPDETRFLQTHPMYTFPNGSDLPAGKTGITEYKNEQGEGIISARYALEGDGVFNGWGWGIIMSVRVSDAFKAAYIIRNTMVILALGIAFFVTLLAILISNKFSRPMREVSESALRISQGDVRPITVTYTGKDEIGDLVDAFNTMAKDLHATTVSRDALTKEIAERKWAEEAVKKSEEKLKNILHGSPIPTFVIDNTHRVIYWNRALEEYSGIKAEEVIRTDHHWKAFYDTKRPCITDLLVDNKIHTISQWYPGKYRASELIDGAYEAVDFFSHLGRNGTWLHFTAAPITDSKGRLIGAVETLQDITETKDAEKQIKSLSRQIIDIQERERESISREIHDDVGQLLSAIKMALSRTYKKIPDELAVIKDQISEISDLMNKAIKEIRGLSHTLHPPLIEDLGIASALEELCEDFKSYSEIAITWNIEQIQASLQSITKITIYRLFQEGLNNILKHSKATKVYLSLTSSESTIDAVIEDNGVGFLVDDVLSPLQKKSLGLISMRERVSLIGGDLKIISTPGKGTKLIACLEKE